MHYMVQAGGVSPTQHKCQDQEEVGTLGQSFAASYVYCQFCVKGTVRPNNFRIFEFCDD